jgi:hypothetical protein
MKATITTRRVSTELIAPSTWSEISFRATSTSTSDGARFIQTLALCIARRGLVQTCSSAETATAHEMGSNAVEIIVTCTRGVYNSVEGETYFRWSTVCRMSCNPRITPCAYVNITSSGCFMASRGRDKASPPSLSRSWDDPEAEA